MDLSRVAMVIGNDAVAELANKTVAVVGLGGVGSYVAEALCRSGIGNLVIVDNDCVAESNINRQLPALVSTFGRAKADVVAERLHDINPDCKIKVIKEFYNPGDFEKYFDEGIDFIADAIDSVPSKTDLLKEALQRQLPVISAMGTGNKLKPELLEVCDISKTKVCPLARKIRKALRDEGIVKGLTVVYSTEEPQRAQEGNLPGSMVFVPASAGLMMASVIVRRILGKD